MVKGISRQVILVEAPEPRLFEQAIFILRQDMGEGVTDDALLKEARMAIRGGEISTPKRKAAFWGALGAAGGVLATAVCWLITAVFF